MVKVGEISGDQLLSLPTPKEAKPCFTGMHILQIVLLESLRTVMTTHAAWVYWYYWHSKQNILSLPQWQNYS